ncbi:acyloxyacyl hydrolase [Paraglaciecola aquimarina]|uniref:Lipid A deacylase n=1 Tax=Paraglaciecola aquimarina TaxID=1235557 RepID=A0ABU3SVN1_9ALTE|nr:acyloxyacyl hydrolase [Paraglaciecola aquimarina]MDU0353982.1 acyloxyacyl hydrolase [Paraglaciecola aquimarina]
MRWLVLLMALLVAAIPTQSAQASEQAVAIDYLYGEDDLTGVRLGYRPFTTRISTFDWLGDLDVYWEVSVNFWEYGPHSKHDTNYAIAISPVFTKQFDTLYGKYPLKWEFGIGVSLVDDTRFAGKDIGSHYQFEDRLGLVLDFGDNLNKSLAVRYMHYSNGGLNDHNPGLDFLNMSYAYHF